MAESATSVGSLTFLGLFAMFSLLATVAHLGYGVGMGALFSVAARTASVPAGSLSAHIRKHPIG